MLVSLTLNSDLEENCEVPRELPLLEDDVVSGDPPLAVHPPQTPEDQAKSTPRPIFRNRTRGVATCRPGWPALGRTPPSRLPIVLHPWVARRAYRMKGIEDFIKYVKGFPNVWSCRLVDVVDWWRKEYRDAHVEEWPNYYGAERASH